MIDFIPILSFSKDEKVKSGIIAIDHMGSIAIYSNSNLTRALAAMFRDTTSLFRTMTIGSTMSGNTLVKQEVTTKDRAAWLSELRRQIPAPYFGGPITSANHSLDQIGSTYQPTLDEKAEDYIFQRLG